ncbi:methyl-accepting chemotaxis protein [Tumebacillus sp. BK434]|uniref:methyl-accepting chemotaxis protein n=1 Tax=Tumebacillus sp. BK434 TaxID=2512169 RepID=UPI001053EF25|nr:methyl-accepting chemotaxis protein [Tumebacillus sp. BK434]TCP59446.1 methyl-accepting chemotaxis protein [Tumebacillus sp. BK434]
MKLSKLIKGMCAIVLILSLVNAASLFWLYVSYQAELKMVDRKFEFKQLGVDLLEASDRLTNEARAYVQFGETAHKDAYLEEANTVKTGEKVMGRLIELGAPQGELDLIKQVLQAQDTLGSREEAALRLADEQKFDQARAVLFGEEYEREKQQISDRLLTFETKMNERSAEEAYVASRKTANILNWVNVVVGLTLVAAIVTGIMLHRRITKPLQEVMETAEKIAAGDLCIEEIHVLHDDEVGVTAKAVNSMAASLRQIIRQANETTLQVAASSQQLLVHAERTSQSTEQIAAAIQEVASGAETQMRGAEDSLASMEEMAEGIKRIAETTGVVAEASQITEQEALHGNETIQKVVRQMGTIHNETSNVAIVIQQLNEHSQQIGKIVEVITDIASQTNLLSLNAAIEAARAGEHGKGFAVVAKEVRKLAEQSQQSAGQIAKLIEHIRTDTARAVLAMEKGSSEVQAGIGIVDEAGEAFQKILTAAQHVADQVADISSLSEEMSAGSVQVTTSVEELTRIARQSAASSNNVAASSQEQLALIQEITTSMAVLTDVSQDLHDTIGQFKI